MGNTPMGCANNLPAILGIPKNDPTSRSVNIFSAAGFYPKQQICVFHQPKLRPVESSTLHQILTKFDQILTKFDQILTIYVKNHKIHVEKIQGRHFLRKKNPVGMPTHRIGVDNSNNP